MVKNYFRFINEADEPVPAPVQPAAQPAPAQPAAQTPAQPAPAQQSGTTQAQTQPTTQSTNSESGNLSNYDNPDATKFTTTVKKMVDIIRELDKSQLIELRTLLAKFKSLEDAKNEIGKL